MTSGRRGPLPWAIAAFLIVLLYAAYLQPDWESYRSDQVQYLMLAREVAARGEYTRAAAGETFVPEPLRTPGYPLALAVLCRTVGCGHWQVAVAQASLLSALVIMVAFIARRIDERIAVPSAAATALYLPFGYFAALPLSDLVTTLALVVAAACLLIAVSRRSVAWGLALGAACAWAALARPLFLTVPVAFGAALLLACRSEAIAARRALLAGALAFAAIVAPPAIAATVAFGVPTSSGGTGLWWGYFQGRWTAPEAVAAFDDAAASADDARIVAAGAAAGLDATEAREAAAAKRSLTAYHLITDRVDQAHAWVDLNRELASRALVLIRHDPWGWLQRGIFVRQTVLWTGELPFRVRDAMVAPVEVRALLMAAQIALIVLAMIGFVDLVASGRHSAWLPIAIVAFTALASFPFVTEPQYSLPAKPFLLIGAVGGVRALTRRSWRAAAVSAGGPLR